MSGLLLPRTPERIAARRRLSVILFVWAWELALAFVVTSPTHAWARRVWGGHPDGDAVLFRPGARALLVWLGQGDAALPVVSRTTMVLVIAGAVASQLALGALLVGIGFARDDDDRPPRLRDAVSAATRAFLPLSALLAFSVLAQGLVVGAGMLASSAVDHRLADRVGDARSFTLRLVVMAAFVVIALVIGVFVDLARAAVARDVALGPEGSAGRTRPAWNTMLLGIRAALTVVRRGRGLPRPLLAWAWRATAGVALLGVGWAASGALGGRGGLTLWLLAAVHQGVVLARVALRASWLARAMRHVALVQDAWTADPASRGASMAGAATGSPTAAADQLAREAVPSER